ncbi:MAG: TIGR03759 family integrating conjugative element protein [gamma proteobacterium symbiont of Lucinoma myriamae]|nr:TIGR03759 family integrating conjugative element protein [gamma proteobacterium symbiont of Lucinoma myriamae]
MKRLSFLLCLVMVTPLCLAQKQSVEQSRYQFSNEQQSQSENSETKEYEAWGLTRLDWKAYQSLMRGHRGVLSPDLDPITALGVEAQTRVERRRLAEIHVLFEKERVEKELAFQREVDQAWTRLYPRAQLIDMAKIAQAQKPKMPEQTSHKGRLLFFTTVSACAECDSALSVLLEQVNNGRKLDIFIASAISNTQIRDWAKAHNIAPEKVRARTITLNHDKGKLGMISQFTAKVPYVAVKVGANRYQEIELP